MHFFCQEVFGGPMDLNCFIPMYIEYGGSDPSSDI